MWWLPVFLLLILTRFLFWFLALSFITSFVICFFFIGFTFHSLIRSIVFSFFSFLSFLIRFAHFHFNRRPFRALLLKMTIGFLFLFRNDALLTLFHRPDSSLSTTFTHMRAHVASYTLRLFSFSVQLKYLSRMSFIFIVRFHFFSLFVLTLASAAINITICPTPTFELFQLNHFWCHLHDLRRLPWHDPLHHKFFFTIIIFCRLLFLAFVVRTSLSSSSLFNLSPVVSHSIRPHKHP